MKRILVAYDGEPPARKALETAIDLATGHDASISVVSVVPIRLGRAPMDPWDDTVVHEAALDEAKQILAEHGMTADLMEPIGDPAATIERIANDGGFDTVVIGSRSLGRVSRLLQGSVSGHVATHAHATVVIAR
ncbi:MAG TPA: universal stress protein [Candidatus Limnocylindrales bacterium]|jgi:nucleotide-binding universal stress UspA family protein|nr:universal stress protein [Candidatus Limnocylindrales bacterium]